MRKSFFLMLIFAWQWTAQAQNGSGPAAAGSGYTITVTIQPKLSGYLYLANYFGSKTYLADSAKLDASGKAVFRNNKALPGGVYLVGLPSKNGFFELLIDEQQQFSIQTDTADLQGKLKFINSPDNVSFLRYQQLLGQLGPRLVQLRNALPTASPKDSNRINLEMKSLNDSIERYRSTIIQKQPSSLLAKLFSLMNDPVIPPPAQHPKGQYDTAFAYQYYKKHYWDNISFNDPRILRNPIFERKLQTFYDKVVAPDPDSIVVEIDKMMEQALMNPEMTQYLLVTFTNWYINPKIMGQDAVFVHLFQRYYEGKKYSWLNEQSKKTVTDRAYSLMGNMLKAPAAELNLLDTANNRTSLYALQAPYTILCFWDPTCGHCIEEVPKLDSLYEADWKKRGIIMVGVMVDGGLEAWKKFIREKQLEGWHHWYDTKAMRDADYAAKKANFRQLYDISQTPRVYLLDKDKKIVAKNLSWQQLNELLQKLPNP